MNKKYNSTDLTAHDVCMECGKDLRLCYEIHVVEGTHFCSRECAITHETEVIMQSANDMAIEHYNDVAEVVTPAEIGLVREVRYQKYITDEDITVIFKEIYVEDEVLSKEIIGFYFGEPTDDGAFTFAGSLKAVFGG